MFKINVTFVYAASFMVLDLSEFYGVFNCGTEMFDLVNDCAHVLRHIGCIAETFQVVNRYISFQAAT